MRERDRELLGMMADSIDDFLSPQHADLKQWDKDAHQPAEFIQSLRDMGLFGLIIPEEHGGMGLSNAAYARVLSQTSRHDSSVSRIANRIFGPAAGTNSPTKATQKV